MMRRATAVLGTAAFVLGSVGAFAQGKPSFAGSWTPDMEKTVAANPNQPKAVPAARPMAIKQDLASFTIERLGAPTSQQGVGPQAVTYSLDNKPMDVDSSKREPNERPAQVRARWVNDTVVFETTRTVQGAKVVSTVVYAREGAWLVVTNTDPDPAGGNKVIKTYYKTTK
jgi:hypothetical protein